MRQKDYIPFSLRLPILNVSAEQQTNSRPLVRPSSHIQALEWNGLSPQWWAILREQALDMCQEDAQDWSFRVEAAPPPGKKGSCNQTTNVSLGPSSGHCQCSPFQTEPLHLRFPGGNSQSGKQKHMMLGLWYFYFVFLTSPCSPFFSPLCSLSKVSWVWSPDLGAEAGFEIFWRVLNMPELRACLGQLSQSCHNSTDCLAIKISYKSVKNTRDPNERGRGKEGGEWLLHPFSGHLIYFLNGRAPFIATVVQLSLILHILCKFSAS